MLAELLTHEGVTEHLSLGGQVGFLALHGGLEAGTAEIARQAADLSGASSYVLLQPPDLAWHLPSASYDPRHSERLRGFLERVTLAVSLHGYGRLDSPEPVLVGGGNRRVASALAAGLRRRLDVPVVDDLDSIPPELRGLHPANPVNLPLHGGVQVELPRRARHGSALQAVVTSLSAVALSEMRSLCAAAGS